MRKDSDPEDEPRVYRSARDLLASVLVHAATAYGILLLVFCAPAQDLSLGATFSFSVLFAVIPAAWFYVVGRPLPPHREAAPLVFGLVGGAAAFLLGFVFVPMVTDTVLGPLWGFLLAPEGLFVGALAGMARAADTA